MPMIGNIEPFNDSQNDFDTYYERLEQLLEVNCVAPERKLSYLITLIGGETYNVLKNLCAPDLPSAKTYTECIQLLKNHFSPTKTVILERFKFNKREQKPNESIGEYAIQLKELSRTCDFGTFLPQALRDKFICGLYNENIQKRLLTEENITFEVAYTKAISFEVAFSSSHLMHHESAISAVTPIPGKRSYQRPAAFDRRKTPSPTHIAAHKYGKCFRCGRQHDPTSCPAFYWSCFTCNKKGHTSKMCRRGSRTVKGIEENIEGNNIAYGEEEEEDRLSFIKVVKTIKKASPVYIDLLINNVLMKAEVDSGACTTVLSKQLYKKHLFDVKLHRAAGNLKSVTGEKLNVVGCAYVDVKYKKYNRKLKVVIIDTDEVSFLLGRSWLDVLCPNWRDNITGNCGKNEVCQRISVVKENYFESLRKQFVSVFQQSIDNNDVIKGYTASVMLKPDTLPIFCKAYTVPFALRPRVEEELERLKKAQVIYPVKTSRWASPIVVVPKKDGKIRLCVDFKVSLNRVTDMEYYPLPIVDEILASLSGSKWFCVIDLAGAYQQMKIAEDCQELFTINTHIGLFRFTRLTYGLKSAPCVFQRMMDSLLAGTGAVCYIDDVLIKGSTIEECYNNTKQILAILAQHNFKINIDKCQFFQEHVEYLGHCVSHAGIKPSSKKMEAIHNAQVPENMSQLKAYLGLLSYYRKFVAMQSSMLEPLYQVIRNKDKFYWNSECQKAFEESKSSLSEKALLHHYDPIKPLILACDASNYGVGAVLSQIKNNIECPIAFASATLSRAERNYAQIEKEALAIVFGVRKFHKFLFGRKFTLLTDHQPLKTIFNVHKSASTTSACRLQRWAILLSAYDYVIKYKKGELMSGPDCMSRLPLSDCRTKELTSHILQIFSFKDDNTVPLSYTDIAKYSFKDPVLSKVMTLIQQGWPEYIKDTNILPYFQRRSSLTVEQGCIVLGTRVVIPVELRNEILNLMHSNHPGIVKMKLIARSKCWWPGIDGDITKICEACLPCQHNRNSKPLEGCIGWPKLSKPWVRIHLDFFDLWSRRFLIIYDATSKWIDVHLMKSTVAESVIDVLKSVFTVFGLPEKVVSDNGPPFTSARFTSFLKCNGIEPQKSPPYFPQANGAAERAVQTVKHTLRKQLNQGHTCSDKEIKSCLFNFLFTYRSSPSPSTGICPSEYLLKYKPRTVLSLLQPPFGESSNPTPRNYKPQTGPKLNFGEGEKVWLKVANGWKPAVVLQSLSLVRYLIKFEGRVRQAHISQLRPAVERESPSIPTTGILSNEVASTESNIEPPPPMEITTTQENSDNPPEIQATENLSDPVLRRSARKRCQPDRLQYSKF